MESVYGGFYVACGATQQNSINLIHAAVIDIRRDAIEPLFQNRPVNPRITQIDEKHATEISSV
jgi:hypothetical protein